MFANLARILAVLLVVCLQLAAQFRIELVHQGLDQLNDTLRSFDSSAWRKSFDEAVKSFEQAVDNITTDLPGNLGDVGKEWGEYYQAVIDGWVKAIADAEANAKRALTLDKKDQPSALAAILSALATRPRLQPVIFLRQPPIVAVNWKIDGKQEVQGAGLTLPGWGFDRGIKVSVALAKADGGKERKAVNPSAAMRQSSIKLFVSTTEVAFDKDYDRMVVTIKDGDYTADVFFAITQTQEVPVEIHSAQVTVEGAGERKHPNYSVSFAVSGGKGPLCAVDDTMDGAELRANATTTPVAQNVTPAYKPSVPDAITCVVTSWHGGRNSVRSGAQFNGIWDARMTVTCFDQRGAEIYKSNPTLMRFDHKGGLIGENLHKVEHSFSFNIPLKTITVPIEPAYRKNVATPASAK